MKLFYCLMVILCPTACQATPGDIQPLGIGQRLPDITVNRIVNYHATSLQLPDFKKPVILDFFETHCGACLAALPYLDRLNEQLKDSLQIIVVCNEGAERVLKFLSGSRSLGNNRLPFITSDTLLSRLFPHQLIPHEVWISKEGIVQAITRAEYVTKQNVQLFIQGGRLNLPLKLDSYQFDTSKSLAGNVLDSRGKVERQTTITGYLDNAPPGASGSALTADRGYRKVYFINMTILSMCAAAFDYSLDPNRFILKVHDSSVLIRPLTDSSPDWFIKNAFCYEIMVPRETPLPEMRAHIISDLGRLHNMDIRLKKQEMPCYILVKRPGAARLDPKSKGGKEQALFFSEDGRHAFMQNEPLGRLVRAMNSGVFGKKQAIIIDETGYNFPVDISLGTTGLKDIAAMQKILEPYGFLLKQGSRSIEMIVVEDIK